jgi:phospholipase/carboxylesterase
MLSFRQEQYGELNCLVAAPEELSAPPRWLVLLCHGFGAPGSDLAALGPELAKLAPRVAQQTVFLFPEGPLSMDSYGLPGGRAWWPLDMVRLQLAIQQGEFRDLRNDRPELLPAARQQLEACLTAAREEYDLPVSRVVLGGFSQGAMLTTDLVLRLPENPAALLIYSGTLVNEPEWTPLAPHRAGLPVLQSHGIEDPILPFEAAEWLRGFLSGAGLETQFISFRGGHTIPLEALQRTAELLERLAADD